mgnify:CR=1 FL=1
MKFFCKKYKIKKNRYWKTQFFVGGIKIFSYTVDLFKQEKKRNLILCWDSLYDADAEAIDMWTFFQYLQKHNIPSKYILLRKNKLYTQLSQTGNFKDIIVVNRMEDFFAKCRKIIAQTKVAISSFGLYHHYNPVLVEHPKLTYIFAQHGSIFLKESVLELYSDKSYNSIISATRKESELYDSRGLWQNGTQIKCGLPRWDALYRKPHDKKNIFVFFTWRTSIEKYPESQKIYSDRIFEFLCDERLNKILTDNNVQLNIAMHHAMLRNKGTIKVPENVNIISTDKISQAIKESDLCITDYSSIFFDFMYLDIPVIFYRFDADVTYPDERDNQNAISAQAKDNQLYNCMYAKDDVIQKIEFYVKNNFELEPKYRNINDTIFWERSDICKHLYEIISK